MSGQNESTGNHQTAIGRSFSPFRRAIFRGLAIIMPPLLTLVLFLWAGNLILNNVLRPIENASQQIIVWVRGDLRPDEWVKNEIAEQGEQSNSAIVSGPEGRPVYVRNTEKRNQLQQSHWIQIDRTWIRQEVYEAVERNPGLTKPTTAEAYCHRYAQLRYLKPQFTIPLFIALFILLLYLLGKFLAAGVGKMIWSGIESIINRIPIISNVYSSVKQVTDFALSENEIQFTRVVAVEYPRRGLWSIGFVTSDSLPDLRNATGEPMLSVLMPTSPMPATGFTISVPKNQTIDLNITVDQAIQFVVSCGVVVPMGTSEQEKNSAAAKLIDSIEATKPGLTNGEQPRPPAFPNTELTESDGFQMTDNE